MSKTFADAERTIPTCYTAGDRSLFAGTRQGEAMILYAPTGEFQRWDAGSSTWIVVSSFAGDITGTGTPGVIPKFTGTQAIGDSIISDDGAIVTIAGDLTAQDAVLTGNLTSVAGVFSGLLTAASLLVTGAATFQGDFAINAPTSDVSISAENITLTTAATGVLTINAPGTGSGGITANLNNLDVVGDGYLSLLFDDLVTIQSQSTVDIFSDTILSLVATTSIGLDAPTTTASGALTVSGTLTANGNVALGNSSADLITGSALFSRDLYPQDPTAGGPWSLGTFSNRWARVQLATGATVWRAPTTVTPIGNGFALGSYTRGSLNWSFEQFNTEAGGDTGSDLILTRWSDAGVGSNWLTITRGTGAYAIVGDGTLTGTLAVAGSFLSIGASPATVGTIRVPNGFQLRAHTTNYFVMGYSTGGTGLEFGSASLGGSTFFYNGSVTASLTLTSSSATFPSRVTAPTFGTITAVSPTIERNAITQVTFNSLSASFAGAIVMAGALTGVTTLTTSGNIMPLATDTVKIGQAGSGYISLTIEHNSSRADGLLLLQTLTGQSSPRLFFNNTTDWPGAACAIYQAASNTLAFTTGATPGTASGTARWTYNAAGIFPAVTNAMTLGNSSFVWSNVVATRMTAPLFGTTSAVDVVIDRNSVTQLTLGSLTATFAGSVVSNGTSSDLAQGSSGNITVTVGIGTQSGDAYFRLRSPAGNYAMLGLRSGNLDRWILSRGNTAESGADAGSPFTLGAYTDAGAFIDNPLTITRVAGGTFAIARPATMSSTLAVTTSITSPLYGTTTAVSPVIQRNSVTQVTFNSLVANFAGDVDLASGKVFKVNGTQVTGARITGYSAMTGAGDKATVYAVGSVTLAQLAGRVKQLQDDLTTHGMIGA